MIYKYFQLFFIFLIILISDYIIIYFFDLIALNFKDIFLVNGFLFFLTLVFFLLYHWLLKIKTKSPFTYLSINFFKMIISLIFLYPIFSNISLNAVPYVLHFFVLYFAYLFIEIFLLIKDSK